MPEGSRQEGSVKFVKAVHDAGYRPEPFFDRCDPVEYEGTIASAEIREAISENTIVKQSSPNSWPDMPFRNATGKNTTTVVRVEAVIELATARFPRWPRP
jgi:hypothetical protein